MNDNSSNKQPTSESTIPFPKRVVILGNDTCSWMTATLLSRHFDRLGIQLTVCSNTSSVSRVAQTSSAVSTTPAVTGLLRNIGVDEHDMLRACHGTYRMATQYSDWATEGRDFWQPLGIHEMGIDGFPLFDVWFSERKAGRLLRPLHSYSAHWTASLAGKSPHSFSTTSHFAQAGNYGFHVDAFELSNWFRDVAMADGVTEITSVICGVTTNQQGAVDSISCDDGQIIPGDLFLDCEDVLTDLFLKHDTPDKRTPDSGWTSWNHQSQCDRTATMRTPGSRQVPVFTKASGHNNGWSSCVPLSNTVETAYHFNSQLETDEEAEQRLTTISNCRDETVASQIQIVPTQYGRRQVFWQANVVRLGNAACRIDAVAGTDLHLQQVGIELLIELFPDRLIGDATKAEYNLRMSRITDEFQNSIRLHHALRRSPAAAEANYSPALSADLQHMLEVYDACGIVEVDHPECMTAEEIRCLFAGCGRLPQRPSLSVRSVDPSRIQNALRETVKLNETIVKDLPLHEELLDWIHTGPFQQNVS